MRRRPLARSRSARLRDRAKTGAGPVRSIRRATLVRPAIGSTRRWPAKRPVRSVGRTGPASSRCCGAAGASSACRRPLELIEDERRHILVLQRVPGRPLGDLELGWLRFGQVMLRLTGLVWALARRGVRHNDLRPENVMVAPDGRIHLVDFDQASAGSLAECLLAGLGLPVGGAPVCNGLFAPLRERLQARLSPRLVRALRGRRLRHAPTRAIPPLPAGASAPLQEAARGLAHRRGMRAPALPAGRSLTTSWNSMACACRASARGQPAGAACATRPRTRIAACSSSAAIWL